MPTMAEVKFFYGPMGCGKSTLALQMAYNFEHAARDVICLTRLDRSGDALITSRTGLQRVGLLIQEGDELRALVKEALGFKPFRPVVIADEAQFYSAVQIEQLCTLADHDDVSVYCFGIATDFRSQLFDGSRRLFELADFAERLQVEALCWCGGRASQNARVCEGQIQRTGAQLVVGDTVDSPVHYQVLCRSHYLAGDLGPVRVIDLAGETSAALT